jgi:hypothetical protein
VSHSEAELYLAQVGKMRSLATAAHETLVALGCSSYVKTIYIGYDIEGTMVAALYAHADHIEVALALPEDAEGQLLVDAGHLTWRTLPVAAVLRHKRDLPGFRQLVAQACERVQNSSHLVMRDNDYFVRRKAGRTRNQSDTDP